MRVAVDASTEAVDVQIDDCGAGPPGRPTGAGIGLIGMRERVEALRGTLSAAPTADGWTVQAHIPLIRIDA